MAKHLIIFGHSPNGTPDPGTTTSTLKEAVEVRKLEPYLKKWGDKSKDTFVFYKGNAYLDRSISKQTGYASVTEIHMDGPKGSGGHVIIFKDYKPDNIDKRLRDVIKKNWGIVGYLQASDGFSRRGDLYNVNQSARHGINYRLLELFFMSNHAHHQHYIKNLDTIAKEMIEAITGEKLSGSTTSKPSVSKPAPAPKPSKPNYGTAEQVAQDIAAGRGDWGNDPSRSKKLTDRGYNAAKVQQRVNEILRGKSKPVSKPSSKTIKPGDTVTTRALYATAQSNKNVRTSNIRGYVNDIDNKRRNPIRLRTTKGGPYLGFTRQQDLV